MGYVRPDVAAARAALRAGGMTAPCVIDVIPALQQAVTREYIRSAGLY